MPPRNSESVCDEVCGETFSLPPSSSLPLPLSEFSLSSTLSLSPSSSPPFSSLPLPLSLFPPLSLSLPLSLSPPLSLLYTSYSLSLPPFSLSLFLNIVLFSSVPPLLSSPLHSLDREGRVMGIVEVSRSIGDGRFKRCGIISVPDVLRCHLTHNDRSVQWETIFSEYKG